MKRVVDVALSVVAILVLAPLLLGITLAVWATMGRPILFRQERVGRGGRVFEILKFRTLSAGQEPGAMPAIDSWRSLLELDADERPPSRLALFLRSSSLDELPQLLNVLRGEMSLVGPRPERPDLVSLFAREYPGYISRHRMDAGITGLAQVHGVGRGNGRFTPEVVAERARLDNEYIESWSLSLDVRILCRTVVTVVRFRQRSLDATSSESVGAIPVSKPEVASAGPPGPVASELNGATAPLRGLLEVESTAHP